MIKHVVCFKLAQPTNELLNTTKEILLSMKDNVPILRGIGVGVDFLHSPRSYDVILEVLLDDEASLEAYQKDEYHCSVVKKHMHAVTSSSVSVDCVID